MLRPGSSGENGPGVAETLRICEELFDKYDADESGFIDSEELTLMIKNYHAVEGVGRSIKKVREEVRLAMREFDHDNTGHLDFGEFIAMFTSGKFKFRIRPEQLAELASHAEDAVLERAASQVLKHTVANHTSIKSTVASVKAPPYPAPQPQH